MKVNKQVTINLGQYESLKLGVENAPSFEEADNVIVSELKRIEIPVSKRIFHCLQWKDNNNSHIQD
jgi:hypothetical protein